MILHALNDLEKVKSVKDKEKILEREWKNKNFVLFSGFNLAFDPFLHFFLDNVPKIIDDDDEPDNLEFEIFQKIAYLLYKQKITDIDEQLDTLLNTTSVKMWNYWYRKILLKNFSGIVTPTQINRVLNKISKKDINAIKFFIPQISFQKHSINKKAIIGKNYIDPFIPGKRSAIVLDKYSKSVTCYTANNKQENLEVSHEIWNALPVSIVLDGVNDQNTIWVTDIMPLNEYKKGYSARSQTDRHEALCELNEFLLDFFDGKLKILAKKLIDLNETTLTNELYDFKEQGIEYVMVKDAEMPYIAKKNSHWIKYKT